MSPRVRFWRWRRNPLRRRSDVAEAWAVLATGVLLATAAPVAGAVVGLSVDSASLREGRDWHRSSAVLVKDAADGTYADQVGAVVRWTAADGSSRTGTVLVRAGSNAGTRATIWLDDGGTLRHRPATAAEAAAQGTVYGVLAAVGAISLIAGGRWLIRVRLDRSRETEWEREWATVGPRWGHRPV